MELEILNKDSLIHMVGIGGVSMSGIAHILKNMGYQVQGSDRSLSYETEKLEKNGIHVIEGHHAENLDHVDFVVYTAAIKPDNIELVTAKEKKIPMMERADFLGEITKKYSETIAICGTHGKTTTTSMTALSFIENDKDPTVQVGAELKQIDGNYRVGNTPYLIIEACEYVESFLKFHPETVIVLNIEKEHLDYYRDLEHIKSAFRKFVQMVPERGCIIVNGDDINCLEIAKDLSCHCLTFGIHNEACDWTAKDITLNPSTGCYSYTAVYQNTSIQVELGVPGYHHIYNSLATIATSFLHNCSLEKTSKAIYSYTGAERRFEYIGTLNGAKIYDDYAHHPTEIKATISAANNLTHRKLWVVFQPHTYSRTLSLFSEFQKTFSDVDSLILTDIYAAREKDDGTIDSQKLAIAINEYSNNCTYISKFEDILTYLKENVQPDDLVLTVGAGTITKLAHQLKEIDHA